MVATSIKNLVDKDIVCSTTGGKRSTRRMGDGNLEDEFGGKKQFLEIQSWIQWQCC